MEEQTPRQQMEERAKECEHSVKGEWCGHVRYQVMYGVWETIIIV